MWLDETYYSSSNKGNWKDENKPEKLKEKEQLMENQTNMPRGLSRFQNCILIGIDESNNIFLIPNGFGKMNKEKSIENLKNHLKDITLIYSDKEATYVSFAKMHSIKHIIIKSSDKENKGLQKINSLHSRLKAFLKPFFGVNNKYLTSYLRWFKWSELHKNLKNNS